MGENRCNVILIVLSVLLSSLFAVRPVTAAPDSNANAQASTALVRPVPVYGQDQTHFELSQARNVLFVLDVSQVMNKPFNEGVSRIEKAKQLIAKSLSSFPETISVGLRTYGTANANTLLNSDLVVPVLPHSREKILAELASMKATGHSPSIALAWGIQQAFESDLANLSGPSVIILLSGGTETGPAVSYVDVQAKMKKLPAKILVLSLSQVLEPAATAPWILDNPSFKRLTSKMSDSVSDLMKLASDTNGRYFDKRGFDLYLKEISNLR